MKLWTIGIGLATLGLLALSGPGMAGSLGHPTAPHAVGSIHTVTVGNYWYKDASGNSFTTIASGDVLVFTNTAANEHEAECHYKVQEGTEPMTCMEDFEGDLAPAGEPGSDFQYTFNTPGLYVIHCNLGGDHAQMKFVVVVTV